MTFGAKPKPNAGDVLWVIERNSYDRQEVNFRLTNHRQFNKQMLNYKTTRCIIMNTIVRCITSLIQIPLPDIDSTRKDNKYVVEPLEAVGDKKNVYVARLTILSVQPNEERYNYSLKAISRQAGSGNIVAQSKYR